MYRFLRVQVDYTTGFVAGVYLETEGRLAWRNETS